MKRFSEQFYKKAETVRLRVDEKRELRERLVSYMEYHPLPAEMKSEVARDTIASQIVTDAMTAVKIPFGLLFKGAAAFAVVLLIGVPIMAERAVPGDALYAIKQVNEELRGTLIFDSYQKVEWETERLNRRIAEARLLASEGRLTEEAEAEVVKAVQEHTESAKKEIAALREIDADEAAIATIALDTTLEVQSTALRGETEEADAPAVEGDTEQSTNHLADVIDASRSQTDVMTEEEVLPSFGKLMARVERNTTRIYELRAGLENIVSSVKLEDVDRRVEDINRSVAEAITLAMTDESAAQQQLIGVLQRTQRVIVYMTELEVSESVNIETLVPMVLTEEEEVLVRDELNTSLEMKLVALERATSSVDDEEILEKLTFGIKEARVLAEKMASSATPFSEFQIIAHDAHALADDLIILLEQQGIEIVVQALSVVEEGSTEAEDNEKTAKEEVDGDDQQTVSTSEEEGDGEVDEEGDQVLDENGQTVQQVRGSSTNEREEGPET